PFEEQASKRRYDEPHGMIEAMRGDRLAGDAAGVADIAAAVDLRVAVEELGVPAWNRYADAVLRPGHRREVEDHHEKIAAVARIANDRDNAVLVVIAIDPPEALRIEVALVERRLRAVAPVEIAHVSMERLVLRLIQQVPVEAAIVIPLVPLPEL